MSGNIMEKTERACSGCGACAAVCPKDTVQLHMDRAGFLTAEVREDRCVECGLCREVCSRFSEQNPKTDLYKARLYALQSMNRKTVRKCSSGGVAHELAESAVRRHYKAVGAVYDTSSDCVFHEVISKESDIIRLDGSKYLQSDPAAAFQQAVAEARENSDSCFYVFGTPCQIAGLDRVLQKYKIRDQFLLTEIFCHGVPSYKLWEEFCARVRKKLKAERFDSVLFRYKKNDWHSYCLRVLAKDRTYYGARETEMFWQVFFENILLGDACYECTARKEQSSADLRIGDYWGARFQNRSDGVSAVFACTERGQKVIEELIREKRFRVLKETDAEEMLAAQNMAGYSQRTLHKEAMQVLRANGNIKDAVRYYRKRQSGRQKLKRFLLRASAVIPDGLRAGLRKANSSRLLKK